MTTPPTNKRILTLYWSHVYRYPLLTWGLFALTTLFTILDVVIPLYYKQFFDTLSTGWQTPTNTLASALFTIIVLLVFTKIARWAIARVAEFVRTRLQSMVMRDLSQSALSYLLGHSYKFFTETFSGTLVRRVNKYARAFEEIADSLEQNLWPLVLTTFGILFVVSRRSLTLGIAMAIWVTAFSAVAYLLTKWRQPLRVASANADSAATGALADVLTNTTTAKLFTGQRYEENRFSVVINDWRSKTERSWRAAATTHAILGALNIFLEFIVFVLAIRFWQAGLLTLGDFALLQAYVLRLTDRIWDLGPILKRLYTALADAGEMVEILDHPYDIQDRHNAKNLVATRGAIHFDRVNFSFHQTRQVLKKFLLDIQPGERVALVGSSGAGKTTVTALLLRLHDIDGGHILIDGQNIADVTQESLHQAIGLVPQEPVLFHRTLMENIRYGRRDATDEEVVEASKRARCHEFISELPLGYETFVGERGIKLSGGERQRVAIARAMVKNAPILVLDEATSSLDSESESLIQQALHELMAGKTAIVIAHRLSTIMEMDRIVVMENGQVADTGTHEELLRKPGTYKKLWEIQAGGFLPGDEDTATPSPAVTFDEEE